MKKLLTIILTLALILPAAAFADGQDVASMSDQELKDMIALCSSELQKRSATPDGWILLFEYEGAAIYQIGEAEISSTKYFLNIPVAVVNDSDQTIKFSPSRITCNGWEIDGNTCGANAHSKKMDTLSFYIEYAYQIEALEDITSLQFAWTAYDWDFKALFREEEVSEHRFW